MYVIFPADEVVCLSYGRILYVPPTSPSEATAPLPPPVRQNAAPASPSLPSTASSSTKSRKSTRSEPGVVTGRLDIKSDSCKSLNPDTANPAPKRPERKKRSFKFPSLSKPKTPVPERKLSFSDFLPQNREIIYSTLPNQSPRSGGTNGPKDPSLTATSKSLEQVNSPFNRRSSRKENSPSKAPKTPEPNNSLSPRRQLKKESSPAKSQTKEDTKHLRPSTSKDVAVNGAKPADKHETREKSPGFRFFRDKANSTGSKDRRPVDFDSLFNREVSVGKLSSGSYHSVKEDSRSRQQQPPEKPSPAKRRSAFGRQVKKTPPDRPTDPAGRKMTSDSVLKDLLHPSYNEHLKLHNGVAFKLVRTVSDFTQQLGQMYEQHAEELQLLVANFRKRNSELRKERPACPSSLFHTWETLLQEVEIDAQALGDIASILGRQVSRPLLERSFHRKIQSRKVFTHRESYETIISKTEEKLAKCRQEYKNAYLSYLANPTSDSLSVYFNTHNAYVQQLHATNGMMEEYTKDTLPSLLKELEEIYTDLCGTVSEAVLQGSEVVASRAMEQCKRYEGLVSQCKMVSGPADLSHLSKSFPAPTGRGPVTKRIFVPPQPPPPPDPVDGEPPEPQNDNIPPPLKDELVIDRLSAVQVKPSHDALKKEAMDLESEIRQIQDALDTLLRIQQRSVEANLYNKANELQEDISMKRFDLRVAQMHLSAINSQKELFSSKLEGELGRERKMSSASTGSMKNKWLKAFKSLKTPPPETEKKNQMYHAVSTIIAMRKNGSAATRELLKGDPDAHNFQEYTYKKITPCDICSQVLRGHTRQGLKCRICKMNVHVDCQDKASKCQTKARLLRRQKSTSEIETRVPEPAVEEERISEVYSMPTINRRLSIRDNNRLRPHGSANSVLEGNEVVDQIYQVLKQATEISNSRPRVNVETVAASSGGSSGSSGQSLNRKAVAAPCRATGSTLAVVNPAPCSTSSGTSMKSSASAVTFGQLLGTKSQFAPHSPRRQKLNLRMKSLSLDSPESTEHVQRRRHHGANTASDPHSTQSSSSRIQSPSSPVHNRRLLSAKNIRMSSVELPDDNEKSPSSASTSPCPSPVGGKKSHRLLPTNLYVVLYNFKSRHQDELDLKAGYKVTVIDTSDPDWWKGKCLGRVGFFPSKYVSKLSSGEKPLQVTHNLQVSDGDNGLMLLRDQIVIQIGEELDGMVMIRSGDNRQGVCPVKFLQEV
ncbi:uncharacterized protein LOC109597113 isoform X3 [Aethina tumida]|uniref:uncharacterized protein LOC109597113 isoform X3 n=1 Tax=Aethina tumida TaxID=116153 RepID=UPI002147DD6E|nr:uncharacterized protein LOC109597113 isoform X3 [Aethina tumida]